MKDITEKPNPRSSMLLADRFFLERRRVHGLLETAIESGVVIINAGEGYGKTFAVNSFLRHRKETAIWFQLSPMDNQPWHFWETYTRALGLYKPEAGEELRKTGFPETAWQISRWKEINRRHFSYPGKYIVIADDFHHLRSRRILNFVEHALVLPIPNRTSLLIGRNEPDLHITALMAKGRLSRIDAGELLFTEEEIAAWFKQRNLELRPEEIAEIYKDTEGWPMALGLLEPELRKNKGTYMQHAFEEGALKFLEDIFFAAIPPEMQRYLIKLSFLEQWPFDLMRKTNTVLPPQFQSRLVLLGELEKLSAFVRYDYYLQGYHIHQVFLDYLRKKQQEIPRDEMKTICTIAGKWYLENGLKMNAALNFEHAGNYAALVDIMDSFPRYMLRSTAAPLLDIIDRLINSDDRDEEDPHFIYLSRVVRGRMLLSLTRFKEAEDFFRESIRLFESRPPSPLASRILAESWHYTGMIALTKHRLGGEESSAPCFEKAGFYYKRHPWLLPASVTICNLGSYVSPVGIASAAGTLEWWVSTLDTEAPRAANPMNGFIAGFTELAHAELAFFRGTLNAAEQYARRAVIKAREKKQYEIEHRGLFFLLRINLCRGSFEGFQESWKQYEALRSVTDYPNRDTVNDIIEGWIYAQLGEPKKAAPWLWEQFEQNDYPSVFFNFRSMVKAKCLYAENKFAETLAFLKLPEHRKNIGNFLLGMLEMSCLAAVAHYKMNEEKAALELLEKAYTVAAANSLDMVFVELGGDMRGLASLALDAETPMPRPWLEDIRSRASAYGKNLALIAEQRGSKTEGSGKLYLTRQERAVLRGLSQGQSREKIADATNQSLSMVKNLIARICEKLNAVNRTDAVRIAAGMGLLEKH